jgi:hypothetical protein
MAKVEGPHPMVYIFSNLGPDEGSEQEESDISTPPTSYEDRVDAGITGVMEDTLDEELTEETD